MRKLCLTLCLVFVFVLLFSVTVLADDTVSPVSVQVGDTIRRGVYQFNSVLDLSYLDPAAVPIRFRVRFVSAGTNRSQFYLSINASNVRYLAYFLPSTVVYVGSSGWLNDEYRTIELMDNVVVDEVSVHLFNQMTLVSLGPTDAALASGSLFDVFDVVSSGLIALLSILTSLFWADGSFTFLGVLSVLALSVSISILLFYLILRFIKLRG